MAEPKTLHTRIINKNATAEEWASSNLTLKKGEIALAQITSADGGNYSVPTYAMKIGDGTHTFSQLNWLVAPASDVYDWAKQPSLRYSDLPEDLKNKIKEIGNITNVMNFRGAFASLSEVNNPEIGDVVVITAGDDSGKEFVCSASPDAVCNTAGDAQDKALEIDNFVLSNGKKISVKFTNTNTASNPYFVIQAGTVTTYRNPIYYQGSAIPSNVLVANKVYTFVYDGTGSNTHWNYIGEEKEWVEFGQETVLSNISKDIDGIKGNIDGIKGDINDLKNSKLQSGTAISVDNTSHKINLLYDNNYFSIDGNNKLNLSSSILDQGLYGSLASNSLKPSIKSSSGTLNIDASVVSIKGVDYAICPTSGSATDKEVSIANFSLYDGVKVRIKFREADTSHAPRLVINSNDSTAKSILMSGVDANKVYTFVYDATKSQWNLDANSQADIAPYLSVTSTGVKIINQTKSLENNDILTKGDADENYLSLSDTYIIDCGGAT